MNDGPPWPSVVAFCVSVALLIYGSFAWDKLSKREEEYMAPIEWIRYHELKDLVFRLLWYQRTLSKDVWYAIRGIHEKVAPFGGWTEEEVREAVLDLFKDSRIIRHEKFNLYQGIPTPGDNR